MYIIKSGVLFGVDKGAEKEFRSPFAEEFFEEDRKSWGSQAWKQKAGQDDSPQALIPRSMIWGGRGAAKPPMPVKFRSVFGTAERLYYILEMSTSCGLFYFDFAKDQEMRLFHRTEFQPRGLFIDEDYGILTTVNNDDGTVHLAEYDPEGKKERIITSGDCLDENPFRHGSAIYYQSSGLARDAAGQIVTTGPSEINKLEQKTGDIETILKSDKFDYLLPRVAGDGTLYCIQTPYHSGPVYQIKDRLIDILLFPWRLLVAIFGFLNAFSTLFAHKPLSAVGGPKPRQIDVGARILHNRMVNLQETLRREGKRVAVSKQWKLLRHSGGETTEIASNVLWFDLDKDGHPTYTDGYSLYGSSGDKLFEADEMVSCVTSRQYDTAPAPSS